MVIRLKRKRSLAFIRLIFLKIVEFSIPVRLNFLSGRNCHSHVGGNLHRLYDILEIPAYAGMTLACEIAVVLAKILFRMTSFKSMSKVIIRFGLIIAALLILFQLSKMSLFIPDMS